MSDTPNFGSILDRPASEVERPKPLAVGTYLCVVAGQPRFDKSSQKGTPYVEFTLKFLEAMEVDSDDLKASLSRADGSTKSLRDISMRATYYITEDALWRLKKFLKDDLQIDDEDMSINQMISESPNRQLVATVVHAPSKDGQSIFANIGDTAPVE